MFIVLTEYFDQNTPMASRVVTFYYFGNLFELFHSLWIPHCFVQVNTDKGHGFIA